MRAKIANGLIYSKSRAHILTGQMGPPPDDYDKTAGRVPGRFNNNNESDLPNFFCALQMRGKQRLQRRKKLQQTQC